MLARRSTDIAPCRCGRERCELRCALLEFALRGWASRGSECVVGRAGMEVGEQRVSGWAAGCRQRGLSGTCAVKYLRPVSMAVGVDIQPGRSVETLDEVGLRLVVRAARCWLQAVVALQTSARSIPCGHFVGSPTMPWGSQACASAPHCSSRMATACPRRVAVREALSGRRVRRHVPCRARSSTC